jgi:catechol-2,3-dioxygenase
MQLKWSHAVLNVKDVDKELDFYTGVLGFTISDRVPVGKNAPEIVFMSQDKSEHHQLALMVMREDEGPSNSLNHLAFRVESFDDIKQLSGKLDAAGVDILPLSHGNTLSLYFSDPERNGLEVFWDTPWHIAQPNGTLWDTSLNETEALAWVEAELGDQPSFKQREVADGAFVNRN